MRNKWPAYAVSLLLTAAVVIASLFLPRILLQRQEARMLGMDNNQGISRYQSRLFPRVSNSPTPSAWAEPTGMPTAQPSDASLEAFVAKIRLLENSEEGEAYQREPTEGEMTMKQAVTGAIEQIEEYSKAGAMLPLVNFPNGYSVDAKLYTLQRKTGATLDYWSIKLAANSESIADNGGITLLMDAETGTILSYKMSVDTKQTQPDLTAGVTFIAGRLDLDGSILDYSLPGTQADTATWVCGKRDLFITLSCSAGGSFTAMSMNMSTKLQIP